MVPIVLSAPGTCPCSCWSQHPRRHVASNRRVGGQSLVRVVCSRPPKPRAAVCNSHSQSRGTLEPHVHVIPSTRASRVKRHREVENAIPLGILDSARTKRFTMFLLALIGLFYTMHIDLLLWFVPEPIRFHYTAPRRSASSRRKTSRTGSRVTVEAIISKGVLPWKFWMLIAAGYKMVRWRIVSKLTSFSHAA